VHENFVITDTVNNTGEAEIQITRIDKIAPEAVNVTYSPSTNTNQDVTVTLTLSEPVQPIP
jgi:tRNA G26 N,N-dimethylase Trm1